MGNAEQLFVAQSAAAGDGVNIAAPFAGAGEVQLGASFLVLVVPSSSSGLSITWIHIAPTAC